MNSCQCPTILAKCVVVSGKASTNWFRFVVIAYSPVYAGEASYLASCFCKKGKINPYNIDFQYNFPVIDRTKVCRMASLVPFHVFDRRASILK